MCKGGEKCQKCIKGAVITLSILSFVQVIFAILKFVFAGNLATADVMEVILKAALTEDEVTLIENSINLLAGGLAGLTILGVVCACFACLCTKGLHAKCSGILNKMAVFLAFAVFLALTIVWLIAGAVLMIPSAITEDFLDTACSNAATSNYDAMKLGGYVDYSFLFSMFVDMDQQFATSINGFMCTDFCICPGLPTDDHYVQYSKVPEETYNEYGRTWNTGFTGDINLAALEDDSVNKPMFWAFNPNTGLANENVGLASNTVQECMDNIDTVVDSYTAAELKRASEAGLPAELAREQAEANKAQFAQLGEQLEENKPEQKFIDLVTFMEEKYECSGLCQPPLFYFTQSVVKGLPKTGCVKPFVTDIGGLFFYLGSTMCAAAVFFILMIIMVFPLCCYTEDGSTKVQALQPSKDTKEGQADVQPSGHVELAEQSVEKPLNEEEKEKDKEKENEA